jgi:hypothetical protein
MIPDYCYDCMNRQIPMTQTPGYPMQGMYQPQMQGPMQMPFMMQGGVEQQVPQMPQGGFTPLSDLGPEAQVVADVRYTQGWLRTQIGQKVKIEFLIGTNMLIDREGTLLDVGISYILIRETETDDVLMCDIYSIKFVRIYL